MDDVVPSLTLHKFMADKDAWDMFVTGRAGTGKTTALCAVVEALQAEGIPYIVCAFTHKACGVLASKLPPDAHISTLDSFLKKRPGINDSATHRDHVDVRLKMGDSEQYKVIIIDEYSMVGERDNLDLIALQDGNDDGTPVAKIIWVGDPYQLPPVKDFQAVNPGGKYWCQLTHVYRTERPDLLDLSAKLVSYISGEATPKPMLSTENFIRDRDIVKDYKESTADRIMLAWTNQRVQDLNFAVAGRDLPIVGDVLWDSSRRVNLELLEAVDAYDVKSIETVMGVLQLGTKWRTLEFLQDQDFVQFYRVKNLDSGVEETVATNFGTANFKQLIQKLTDNAVTDNKKIEDKHGVKASTWAHMNKSSTLARRRGAAWRRLLSFKESALCLDFPYAMTIHKSQGSTYDEVYLDTDDLARCAAFGITMYARLFYVAVTRATTKVVTT
jgi:ATP-dependent exoDNAse (exonuclease V) alpha subunit